MRMKRIVLSIIMGIILILVIALIYFLPALFIGGVFEPAMTPQIAQHDYDKYNEQFNEVAQYILNNDIDKFYINENTVIDMYDKKVWNALNLLFDAGYSPIGISENTLYFQKYATLDCGKGIMYSMDGKLPYMQFLTDSQELSAENWYYYEDDYNKWRAEKYK